MKDFIALCVQRPVTVMMTLFAILLAGIFSLTTLPIDRFPEIVYPRLSVETKYPGMNAEDIRNVITIPVEDALSPVKGLERLRSISRDGESIIILDFHWGINSSSAAVLVREAIDTVYPTLPEGVLKPVVLGSEHDDAHAIICVSSKTGDSVLERNFCEYELKARLRRIEGIGAVVLSGGEKNEIKIELNVERAMRQGFTTSQLAQTLAYDMAELPAGSAKEGELELVVLSSGKPKNINELSQIIIAGEANPLYLKDIAVIHEASERKKSFFAYNGKEQTSLELFKRAGADPVRLSYDIKRLVKETNDSFSKDFEINILYDTAPVILQSLHDLIFSILLGIIAVSAVLFLFIGSFRYCILVAFSIPVSAAASFISLAVLGKSLNSMSLSGLALGIGLVSDTSVVILDVLCKNFADNSVKPAPAQIGMVTASLSNSSFSGTATTAVVFIPVLFLPGPLGMLFGDLSISLVSAVITGWLFAQFALPVLFSLFFKPNEHTHSKILIGEFYKKMLLFVMRNEKCCLIGMFVFTGLCFLLLFSRPVAFVSAGSANEIVLSINYPTGTRPESSSLECINILKSLQNLSCIQTVFCRAGSEDEDLNRRASASYRKETAQFRCFLKSKIKPDKAFSEIQDLMKHYNCSSQYVLEYPQEKTELLLGLSSLSTLAIHGNKGKELEARAIADAKKLKQYALPLILETNVLPVEKKTEIRIVPRRGVAAATNITTALIAQAASSLSDGVAAGQLEIDGRPVNIMVSGEHLLKNIPSEAQIEKIPLRFADESALFVGSVADVRRVEAPQSLARLDRSDVFYIEISAPEKNKNNLQKVIGNYILNKMNINRVDDSAFKRYKTSILLTVILVVVLLYMTMGMQFESFVLPLIFMVIIPFSIAGAGPLLALFGCSLDSGSVLAIIVLFGLTVNNGIVLYETIMQKKSATSDLAQLVYDAALLRFYPILATSMTSIIVLIPLLFNPLGATQKSMAAAMTGGCAAGTFLTLLALPSVYIRFIKNGRKTI